MNSAICPIQERRMFIILSLHLCCTLAIVEASHGYCISLSFYYCAPGMSIFSQTLNVVDDAQGLLLFPYMFTVMWFFLNFYGL